jgi:hypothetical protein
MAAIELIALHTLQSKASVMRRYGQEGLAKEAETPKNSAY